MRLEGWESRLALLVEEARHAPYAIGEHDCFRFACRVVEALTGVDHWPAHAGYRSRREALEALARLGSSFEEAFDRIFGARVDPRIARRGDLVAVQTADGEKHLGVVVGREAVFLAPDGLRWVPVRACRAAWGVG